MIGLFLADAGAPAAVLDTLKEHKSILVARTVELAR